jgi:DNA helicase II / ATP-dependent DNA helicase PcrA
MPFQSPHTFKMQSASRIVLASAGSGKTTKIINEACSNDLNRAALITYTLDGCGELEECAYRNFRSIPTHVKIATWYSFVLAHFVRPYQNHLYSPRINGIKFDYIPVLLRRIPKSNTGKYYFYSRGRIWRDRVTDFACQVIDKTDGLPLRRIESIFGRIFIDEAQDLSGWDLELVEHILKSKVEVTLVGDCRQATYSTNNNQKNKQYSGSKIVNKFREWEKSGLIEMIEDNHSHRCTQKICDLADELFPSFKRTVSLNKTVTTHDGVVLVRQSDLARYVSEYSPQPLRYDRKTDIPFGTPMNFGEAKGLSFDRVIIFAHGPLLEYLSTNSLTEISKSVEKCYVAITRARQSVAIVVPDKFKNVRLPVYSTSK